MSDIQLFKRTKSGCDKEAYGDFNSAEMDSGKQDGKNVRVRFVLHSNFFVVRHGKAIRTKLMSTPVFNWRKTTSQKQSRHYYLFEMYCTLAESFIIWLKTEWK